MEESKDQEEKDKGRFAGVSNKEQETTDTIKSIANKNKGSSPDRDGIQILCKCEPLSHISNSYNNSNYLEEGWEGSALVAHGSILRFGCLVFLFSTVDHVLMDR